MQIKLPAVGMTIKNICIWLFQYCPENRIGKSIILLNFKDKYSCLLRAIILFCNSPVKLLILQRKYPISHR